MLLLASEAWRFWRKTPWRTALLLLALSAVTALSAVNGRLLLSSLWFTPPGMDAQGHFATLGQYSPEGGFSRISENDLARLDNLGLAGRYSVYADNKAELAWDGQSWKERPIALVSERFFALFGVDMALGEPFSEARQGVVLSHRFWRERLGGRKDVIGKLLGVVSGRRPIVGVASAEFRGLSGAEPEVYLASRDAALVVGIGIPLPPEKRELASAAINRAIPQYRGVVLLRHAEEREALSRDWHPRASDSVEIVFGEGPGEKLLLGFDTRGYQPAVLPGLDFTPGETAVVVRYLGLLLVQTGILALLAALNLGAFLAARIGERGHELSLRVALGAGIPRLLSDLAGELLPFFALAAALALPLGFGAFGMLLDLEPFRGYFGGRFVSLDLAAFAPALALLALIAVLAVIAPCLLVRQQALRTRSLSGGRLARAVRPALALVQWSLVFGIAAVAIMAGLSAQRLGAASWGGDRDAYVLPRISAAERDVLREALRAAPDEVGEMESPPLEPLQLRGDYALPALSHDARQFTLYRNSASVAALNLLGIPLRAGRWFAAGASGEVVVSEALARALDVAPERLVGQVLKETSRLLSLAGHVKQHTIVGVAADVHYAGLREAPELVLYRTPERDSPFPRSLILPFEAGPRLQAAASELARDRPELAKVLAEALPMSVRRDANGRTERVLSLCTVALSVLALCLLLIGVVSDARFLLALRGRELALRAALGARLGQCAGAVLGPRLALAALAASIVGFWLFRGRGFWLARFPMLSLEDAGLLVWGAASCMVLFAVVLAVLCWQRLSAMALAQLLRLER